MYRIKNITKLNPHIRGARSVLIEIGGQIAKIRSRKEVVISDKEFQANKKLMTDSANPADWDENVRFLVMEAPKVPPKPKMSIPTLLGKMNHAKLDAFIEEKKLEIEYDSETPTKKERVSKILDALEKDAKAEVETKPVDIDVGPIGEDIKSETDKEPVNADIVTSDGSDGKITDPEVKHEITVDDEIPKHEIKPPPEKPLKDELMEMSHKEIDILIEKLEKDKGLKFEYSRANPNKEEKVTKYLAALQ